VVWVSRTANDIEPSRGSTTIEPEETQGEDSPTAVPLSSDEPKTGNSTSSASPPPPPIDVVAIDKNAPLPPDDPLPDERRSSVDEYCHSPLGGAMPESDDSDAAEFVFP